MLLYLSEVDVLLLLLIQDDLQVSQLCLGLSDAPGPLLLLLLIDSAWPPRQTLTLEHFQQLLDRLVPGPQRLLLRLHPQLHLLQGLSQEEELFGLQGSINYVIIRAAQFWELSQNVQVGRKSRNLRLEDSRNSSR